MDSLHISLTILLLWTMINLMISISKNVIKKLILKVINLKKMDVNAVERSDADVAFISDKFYR
ncbi:MULTISPECIES: hypothetical protein [unclassified Clostridioides]|uniref:hypothetical protein n=1 Tax=unclassified Clostridioides TaxID=2635829 RepID=UPI001D12B15C|nr:hypothetical protein [Clostridioides sp. ES-S-0171-01]MCC0688317.1 hypothetical protein [Clostridioides sp. ES-S-0056-01]MCC0715632.1 hypothetical protein [Clostridioides sp. ES-S-0077-01]UDN54435.1 hypothetical protein JJC02_16440 [Clostridioides sp. ES-S-0054-01]